MLTIPSTDPTPQHPLPRVLTSSVPSVRLYSVFEVAEALRTGETTVRAAIREGRLRSTRIGRRVLVSSAELARFIEAHTAPSNCSATEGA